MQAWHKVEVKRTQGEHPDYRRRYLAAQKNKLEDEGVMVLGDWQLSPEGAYRIRVDIPDPSFMLLP